MGAFWRGQRTRPRNDLRGWLENFGQVRKFGVLQSGIAPPSRGGISKDWEQFGLRFSFSCSRGPMTWAHFLQIKKNLRYSEMNSPRRSLTAKTENLHHITCPVVVIPIPKISPHQNLNPILHPPIPRRNKSVATYVEYLSLAYTLFLPFEL